MAVMTSQLLRPVHPAHRFDEVALLRYATAHVEGFPSPSQLERFSITQFGHGQSNPTYCLETVSNGTSPVVKRYVLRKKPPGVILQSTHAVEREYQVLKALGDHTDVPVPKVFCLCHDSSIIGTPFYIMECLEGRIYADNVLAGVEPEKRRVIYLGAERALAALHRVDVDSIGLQKYGRRDDYCKRQEICLGIIGNLACHESLASKLSSLEGLIETVVQQLFLDDSCCLTEAFKLLEAAIQNSGYASWSEALLSEEVLKRVLWILENTLNLSLFEKACK